MPTSFHSLFPAISNVPLYMGVSLRGCIPIRIRVFKRCPLHFTRYFLQLIHSFILSLFFLFSFKADFLHCKFIIGDMFKTPDSSLYPLHRCKTLHLVRHAQGYHNVTGDIDRTVLLSHELVDASLTPLGWQQVDNLRKQEAIIGIASRVELVVTSPLTRTMQTAAGVFGGGDYIDSDSSPPLMVAGAGKSDRAAISSSKCPPFLAMELCRERMGLHPCDRRKSISEYRTLFPAIDFSLVETDEDVFWKPDTREKEYDIAARGLAFLNWLLTRTEKEIAIISHKGFLVHTMALFGKDCHPVVRNEIHKELANCELRSFVIADRSAVSTSLPETDFPGHIPSCLNGVKGTENENTLSFPRSDVPIDCDDVMTTKKEFTVASK